MLTGKGIAITGIGVISPIGTGRDVYWDALFRGVDGIRPITLFDPSPHPLRIAGEITEFDALPILGKKGLRDLDRSTRLLCSAAKLALDDSRLVISDQTRDTVGVCAGATYGSLHSISQFDRVGLIEGPRAVNPSHFPNTVLNSPASQVSIRFGIKGFNTTISTGFCAGLDAVCYAADVLSMDRAVCVLAGGVEELCEETYLYFHHVHALAGARGPALSCPFDRRRDGLIPGEGSSVIMLEQEEHARSRGADVLARVLGWANHCDPSSGGRFEGTGQGLARAIHDALRVASLEKQDIDYVCSGANATKGMDRLEASALRDVFGDHIRALPVSSIKSMIGETYSASGAMALAAAVGVLRTGVIPPTINFAEPDPDCALDTVPVTARNAAVRTVLITAADPQGGNTAVILASREEALHGA